MPQVINTNIMSLTAQRNLNSSQTAMQTSLQRLSSGLRINSAKDDAAGLAISERFTAQINGYNQAIRNANDGISLAQTAEGAMQEMTNNLQRIRELAVQALNATNSTSDRISISQEVSQLVNEIDRTSGTRFNGVLVIGGDNNMLFQIGPDAGDTIAVQTSNITQKTGFASLESFSTVTSLRTDFSALLGIVDTSLDTINSQRATFGAVQNRFESVVRNGQNVANNLSASRSRIQDADFAAETAALTRAQILQQAGTAMLSQANQVPQQVLQLLR